MKSSTSLLQTPQRQIIGMALALLVVSASPLVSQISFSAVTDIGRIEVNDMVRNAEGELLVAGPGGFFVRGDIEEAWEKIDFQYQVYSLERLSDGTLLAGTERGIRRSTDGGRSWSLVANLADVGDFTVSQKGTIMATTFMAREPLQGFIYISEDQGRTWNPVATSFGTLMRNNVVALGDLFFIGSSSGLKLSYNKGEIWETTRLIDSVGSLIVTESGVLVAATGNGNIRTFLYESHDTGRSWIRVDSLPGIRSLTPGKGKDYFITVDGPNGRPGENQGLWMRTAGEEGRRSIYAADGILDILVEENGILLAENFRLRAGTVGGQEWRDITGPIMNTPPGKISTAPDGSIYAMIPDSTWFEYDLPQARYALFSSEDNGRSWTYRQSSFSGSRLETDLFGNIYLASSRRVWKKDSTGAWATFTEEFQTLGSGDGGKTMEVLVEKGMFGTVAADRESGVIALNAKRDIYKPDLDVLFSLDSGATWHWFSDQGYPFEHRDTLPLIRSIAVAADGAIVLALSGEGMTGIYRATISGDGGSGISLADNTIVPPTIVRMDDNRLLAGSALTGAGMYRSSDNGRTWGPVAEGQRMQSIVPLGEGTLWGDLRFFSNDYGSFWFGAETLRKVVRGKDRLLYAISGPGIGYRKSLNNGKLWIDADFQNISPYGTDIAINSNGYIFVAANDGLYYSAEPASVPAAQSTVGSTEDQITIEVRGEDVYITGSGLQSEGSIGRIYDVTGRMVSRFPLHAVGPDTQRAELPELPAAGTWLLRVSSGERQASTLIVR